MKAKRVKSFPNGYLWRVQRAFLTIARKTPGYLGEHCVKTFGRNGVTYGVFKLTWQEILVVMRLVQIDNAKYSICIFTNNWVMNKEALGGFWKPEATLASDDGADPTMVGKSSWADGKAIPAALSKKRWMVEKQDGRWMSLQTFDDALEYVINHVEKGIVRDTAKLLR
jgi:hypothetical protein